MPKTNLARGDPRLESLRGEIFAGMGSTGLDRRGLAKAAHIPYGTLCKRLKDTTSVGQFKVDDVLRIRDAIRRRQ